MLYSVLTTLHEKVLNMVTVSKIASLTFTAVIPKQKDFKPSEGRNFKSFMGRVCKYFKGRNFKSSKGRNFSQRRKFKSKGSNFSQGRNFKSNQRQFSKDRSNGHGALNISN